MADVSSHQERQDEEFQALEAIFGSDLEDLRLKAAWKVAQPLELKLTLRPQQSMSGPDKATYVQLDMLVRCPSRYPDLVPEISFANWKGLSDSLVAGLKQQIETEALDNAGEVMLWQLANSVQEFLHKHNNPPPLSFYEQMIKNKQEQEERIQVEERRKQEERRRRLEEEAQIMQEVLRKETRRRKEDHKNAENNTPVLPPGSLSVSKGPSNYSTSTSTPMPIMNPPQATPLKDIKEVPNDSSPVVTPAVTPVKSGNTPPAATSNMPNQRRKRRTSTPKRIEDDDVCGSPPYRDHLCGVSTLTFKGDRTIQRGKYLGRSSSGCTVYAGMDQSSGDLVAVAEWVLQWRQLSKKAASASATTGGGDSDKEGEGYMRQLAAAEQEFNSLNRLKHPNLIHYLAFKYQYLPGKITVHLLMEYSGGTNLAVNIYRKSSLPLEILQKYVQELLEALKYLHQNSIVHKNLRASSIFIDTNGRLRLADYSIDKRLCDLYETIDRARPGVHFSDGPMVLGRGGQRGDIYQLGLVVLSLVLGRPLTDSIPDVPTDLPHILQDFLHKCLLKDERLRWTVTQLLEHKFVKEPIQRFPYASDSGGDAAKKYEKTKGQKLVDDQEVKDEENFEYLSSLVASGQSRLASEFDLLKVLGKGGFGEVLKVKNKLDGRFYAIKRIPLNPKSKLFNKKMKREVKSLSSLNHENVVRYYCSWIEISEDVARSESSSSMTPSSISHQARQTAIPGLEPTSPGNTGGGHHAGRKGPHIVRSIPLTKTPVLARAGGGGGIRSTNCSFDPVVIGDVDNLVPRIGDESVEWLTSFDHGHESQSESSSDEEEDEADVFGTSFMPKIDRSDDSIVFDDDENGNGRKDSQEETSIDESNPSAQEADSEPEELTIKILYIQMEYCEKSTLRTCIDSGLSKEPDRMWRLFREIIDGLDHIHSQGMIHRDLKPVNIFMDHQDHVKIGDFGLATDIRVKEGTLLDKTVPSPQDQQSSFSRSGLESGDGNLTGEVGTALYVSPEVMQGGVKVHYDQKVDIYSLGIMFFEMSYKCLPTGMERIKILNNLRQPTIEMPDDFDASSNKAEILCWLLNHDPAQRPTSKQLLNSKLLPLPSELRELLHSTVANPASSSYKHMLQEVFSQTVTPHHDLIYDYEIYEHPVSSRAQLLQCHVERTLAEVFSNHGAVRGPSMPAFQPKCALYETNEQHVRMMDQRGGIISMPLDLRVPFARYVGKHNIQNMKRFAIEKVYREKKFCANSTYPRELTECTFDIVTTFRSSLEINMIPDAEALSTIQEIVDKYPSLQARKYYVRINHMSMLRAFLYHCDVPDNLHAKALSVLAENSASKKGVSALEADQDIKLSTQAAAKLAFLLDIEGSLKKVTSIMKSVTKTSGEASSLAKSGLYALDWITSHADKMGLKLQVIVTMGLVYKPDQYSGVLYQVMCDCKRKKKIVTEVLALGGCYDILIEQFPPVRPTSNPHTPVHGVGVSIYFDRLVAVIAEDEHIHKRLAPYDVLVCTLGRCSMVKERLDVARDLWTVGFRTSLLYDQVEDFEELQKNCRNQGVAFLVVLEQGDSLALKGQHFPSSKQKKLQNQHIFTGEELVYYVKSVFTEGPPKIVGRHELVEYLAMEQIKRTDFLSALKPKDSNDNAGYFATSTNVSCNSSSIFNSGAGCAGSNNTNSGSNNSNITGGCSNSSTAVRPSTFKYNFIFEFQDNKKYSNAFKRRHEAVVAGKVSSQYPWLPEKNLEVLVLDLPAVSVKVLVAELDLTDESAFESSKKVLFEKLIKLREYLVKVFDIVHDLRFDKRCNFIIIYSLKDEVLKLLT